MQDTIFFRKIFRSFTILVFLYFCLVIQVFDGNTWNHVDSIASSGNELNPLLGLAMPDLSGVPVAAAPAGAGWGGWSTTTQNTDNLFYGLQYFYTPLSTNWLSFGAEATDYHVIASRKTAYQFQSGSFQATSTENGDMFMLTPLLLRVNLGLNDTTGFYFGAGAGVLFDLMAGTANTSEPVFGYELYAGLVHSISAIYSIFAEWRVQIAPNLGGGMSAWADIVNTGVRIHF